MNSLSSLTEKYLVKTLCLTLLVSLFFLSVGCSNDPADPEAEIRQFIQTGQEVMEARSRSKIKKMISENYLDQSRRKKQDIISFIFGYILRNQSIHLITSIQSINLPQTDKAEVVLLVGMAGQPVTDNSTLLNINADLYRFDLLIQKENNDWLLTSASWQQAHKNDFQDLPQATKIKEEKE